MWAGWPLLGSTQGASAGQRAQHVIQRRAAQQAPDQESGNKDLGIRITGRQGAHQTCSAARAGCRR